tara:strand:+ start:1052 stop:1603 length:552 start_codon:yes stop_codon:yes gene_type:complete
MILFKIKIILLLLTLFINGCVSSFNLFLDPSHVSGIVKSRYESNNQLSYTHKYLNGSLKALPLIITTGTFKNSGQTFSKIDFKVYNKKQPINYKYVELYNSKGEKWEWEIFPKHKSLHKEKHFFIESYKVRIDSQVAQLLKFFNDDAIYLKFIGDVNNFKRLDTKHRISIVQVLKFAKNLSNL